MRPVCYQVVLVDDADDVRAVVARQLRLSRRFEVVGEGGTGADAIKLATEHQPDLMLLDASMPDMDGLEALPHIHKASPATMVVMFSGFGGETLEMAARTLGAVDFVEKNAPIRELPGRLLQTLETADSPPSDDGATGLWESQPDSGHLTDDEADKVLAQHLERFRTVFNQAAIGMATMTLRGTVVRANLALTDLAGTTEAELLGRPYFELADATTRERLSEAIGRVGRGDAEVMEVEHVLDVAGQPVIIRSTLTVVRDADGRPLYLFAQAEDITARRHAVDALQASEERFRLLVEGAVDYAIFMLDPTGTISTWNAGAARMKGYSAEEIVGQHFRVFYPPEAQQSRHPEHELELAIRDGSYEEEGWRVRQDGTRFWANVVITALFDHGRLVGFGKVTRDITERRRQEEARERVATELADANRLLRAANEQTKDLLAITAHELQSPLTAITGAADIIAEHWDDLEPSERDENMQNLARSAARTRRLLDDLLMASRLESKTLEFEVADFALCSAIHEAVAATDPSGTVETVCAADLMVSADRTRLVQMVANLVSNALHHGSAPVLVEARPVGRTVEMVVCDSGPGVAEDLEPRLFQKFARGHGRRPDRGTGLGLFIVREMARSQGGDAWYERRDGRPCFGLRLTAP